ncbi:MAG: hypothetical protein NTY66_01845 [Candidatus Vogelbacteria bacterium]|nr:hypothetical protein [Candidatus Vogelbacteria bacterium]
MLKMAVVAIVLVVCCSLTSCTSFYAERRIQEVLFANETLDRLVAGIGVRPGENVRYRVVHRGNIMLGGRMSSSPWLLIGSTHGSAAVVLSEEITAREKSVIAEVTAGPFGGLPWKVLRVAPGTSGRILMGDFPYFQVHNPGPATLTVLVAGPRPNGDKDFGSLAWATRRLGELPFVEGCH